MLRPPSSVFLFEVGTHTLGRRYFPHASESETQESSLTLHLRSFKWEQIESQTAESQTVGSQSEGDSSVVDVNDESEHEWEQVETQSSGASTVTA